MHTEYQLAASRTMPSTSPTHLPNWALGLCGEVAELFSEPFVWADAGTLNARKVPKHADKYIIECGDVLWYCHALLTALRVDANSVLTGCVPKQPFVSLYHHACSIAELVKKHVYHFKPLDTEALLGHIINIVEEIERSAGQLGQSLTEVYRLNVEKLQKRWPDSFSPEGAQ